MLSLVCLSRALSSVAGFQPVRFSPHMAGSCQNQCEGSKGSLVALLNHGVPSTSQNSCRVGAGRPQIRVHWSVYIRSLGVYQSNIMPASCTIDLTVFCSKAVWGKWPCAQQTTAERWILLVFKWMDLLSARWMKNRGTLSSCGKHAGLVVLFSSWKPPVKKLTEGSTQPRAGKERLAWLLSWTHFRILDAPFAPVSQNFNMHIYKLEIISLFSPSPKGEKQIFK